MITLDLSILNQKGTPMFYSDTLAARPAFGIAGRIFIDIASPYGIYRDTGTAWVQIAATGTSGAITGGGTINTIAMFTPSGTAVGDSKITQSGSDINIDANVFVTNGNINLPANNTVGGTTYKIQQVMATNDGWSIYGNAVATDRGEVVFEVFDNGAQFNPSGQRYRFHYEATSSGTSKDPLIIDYNLSTFTTAIDVNHVHTALAGASNPYGQQIAVTNTFNAGITWTALLACFNTSSLMNNNWNGSATFGNGSYTGSAVNVLYNTFNAVGSTITNTQASDGVRAWANEILQLRIDGTNNGTYTHFANSVVYGDFASSTARLTITNRYGYLVNNLDEYAAGHTYGARWAFYNAGVNDNNFFAGKVGIGLGYSPTSNQLDVIGTAAISYSNNSFGGGFFVKNTNNGANALNALGLLDSSNNIVSTLTYYPNTFVNTSLRNSVVFNTGLQKIGFLANAAGTGSIAQDIYFSTLLNRNNIYLYGATGNVVIQNGGTFADAGYRLDVQGSMRIVGATTMNDLTSSSITIGTGQITIGYLLTNSIINVSNSNTFQLQKGGQTYYAMNGINHVYTDTSNVLTSDNSAALLINSTLRGFLPPRMSTSQKNAITTPAQGLILFDTTLVKICVYNGTTWETVTSL